MFATGVLAAHAGREEVRYSADPLWRMEAFLAFAVFVAMVAIPTALYFYVFHADWFLLYWVDTGGAPVLWGFLVVGTVAGVSVLGFRLGAALCRGSRAAAPRRVAAAALVCAVAVWPLAWGRLAQVGSYRHYTRDYGLTGYFSSAAFFAGLVMMILLAASFLWVAFRLEAHTQEGME